jgi:hypothetical protein
MEKIPFPFFAMRQLTAANVRLESSTAPAVIDWRGKYTSNSGHEGEQSARPFRANTGHFT